jgi:CheY-like chemotaxis protein
LTACSGAEGVERALEHRPDAILLDVMMPGMDGAATYAALRSNPATRDIPVVLLTAKIFDRASDRRGLEGITVISKPFDPMRLATQVSAALGWAG